MKMDKHRKGHKYWILTISYNDWKPPERIQFGVKFIRGQLLCKSQNLFWQIVVQYFEPMTEHCVKEQFAKAQVEPIYSLDSWGELWDLKNSCQGTLFEMGDKSDLIKEPNQNTQSLKLDIDDLKLKLKSITENLYFLKNESLTRLWSAVENAQMIDFVDVDDSRQDDVNEEFYGLLTPPMKKRNIPKNHGKMWKNQELEELDKLLKVKTITLEDIADKLGRTRKSIEMKAIELVIKMINGGSSPERAIHLYGNKVGMEMLKTQARKRQRII
jgi:hypothetical protein